MDQYICIHGHFYQPPRENPWLEEVELQEEAYPYHDWNEKITAECYAPNASSRILDSDGKIIDITNIYSKISFDFGPTLLSWLERHSPDVYNSVLDADRISMEKYSGHGSAMAQAYNHLIMPLANKRDKYTQVIWGIRDFEKRFKRFPEGMWLPEAAVDLESLEVLADLGIKFTILSQRQAKKIGERGETVNWVDVKGEGIDPTMAYLCVLPSGRTINLFFYDGPISHEISFGDLLRDGKTFAKKLLSAFKDKRPWPQIVNVATDGETFGHHHRFGDMALSYCLHYIESNMLAQITSYGEYLEKHQPNHIVEIIENSSWSCVHGVNRWSDNCGCSTGMNPGWTQEWRKPLRDAMDWLRDELASLYESESSKYLKDPWEARNNYIDVILDRSRDSVGGFLSRYILKDLSKEEKIKMLKLFEMQRNAMLMYTSCGWFFDEISGIEAIQLMQYALRAMQYAEDLKGRSFEPEFVSFLKNAKSNIYGNAVKPFEMFAKPAMVDLIRVGAHYSISSVFEEYPEQLKICCYNEESSAYDRTEAGKLVLATGKAHIISDITWEEETISFAVLHLGDHNINAGVKVFSGEEDFTGMQGELKEAFKKGDIPESIRLMDKHFDGNIYSLLHLFKDEQIKILHQILQQTYEGIAAAYRRIFENNYSVMNFFYTLQIKLPGAFASAAEYILNTDLKKVFEDEDLDTEKLTKLIGEAKKWTIKIDTTTIGFVASSWVSLFMEKLNERSGNIQLFNKIDRVMEILKPLSLPMNLWKAQNIYFSMWRNFFVKMNKQQIHEDSVTEQWVEGFRKLGKHLQVKV